MVTSFFLALAIGSTTGPVTVRQEDETRWLVIDLKAQRLYGFEGLEKVFEYRVSTGRAGLDTPTGAIQVQRKDRVGTSINGERLEYLIRIHMWDPKMKMWRRINIHEYKSVPLKAASSGCIRSIVGEGRKVYEWIRPNDWVYIVADSGSGCLL